MSVPELIEKLAALEHRQWEAWSKELAEKEKSLSPERIERWSKFWVPYNELTEEVKEYDRIWARQVMEIFMHWLDIKGDQQWQKRNE